MQYNSKTTESLLWSFFFVNLTCVDNIKATVKEKCRLVTQSKNISKINWNSKQVSVLIEMAEAMVL